MSNSNKPDIKITIINPPIVEQGSISTTIPLGIAYLAGYSRAKGVNVKLIDGLGEKLNQRNHWKDKTYYVGMSFDEIVDKIDADNDFICLSANFSVQQRMHLEIIKRIKQKFPGIIIIVGGNDSTLHPEPYINNGVDFAILGEGENTLYELISKVKNEEDYTDIDGLAFIDEHNQFKKNPKTKFIQNLDEIPFPARDLLPLEKYWKKKYSHGPIKNKYTPIASSRGCPLSCAYCSSIIFWQRKWRARSPNNFVDEVEECYTKFGITDFEFEDDVFSFKMQRAVDICEEIIRRGLGSKIRWTTPNGIRPDGMTREILKTFKKSGCNYLVFAPESGSQRLLREVYNKFINLDLIADMVKVCHEIGIPVAAFIIIGLPAQTDEDYRLTKEYIKRLARNGLNEVGVWPVFPYPNTPITQKYFPDYEQRLEEDNTGMSLPKWYPNREDVAKRINEMYLAFYTTKLMNHPIKSLGMIKNIISLRQETKTERSIIAAVSKFKQKFIASS
jgi:anaerobic magnesium-protoporphyrin IX monomethyl ester cyclase